MIQAAIIGAAGLSGQELVRLLSRHPDVELRLMTSSRYAGQAVGDVFPLLDRVDGVFAPNDSSVDGCQVAFLAVPNQASLELAASLLAKGVRVVDLSGVFRLRDVAVFQQFYGMAHTEPELLKTAVFGLPEAFRGKIRGADLVANPGCYPTGALLGLLPLGDLAAQLASPPVIDAKSGVSGAGGRVEDDSTGFMAVNENFKAYKIFSHQHLPEIEQYLEEITPYARQSQGRVVFTPHLLPVGRGILSTIYLRFSKPVDPDTLRERYAQFARKEPFVRLMAPGRGVELNMAQGTNRCVISLHPDDTGANWVVVTAIDNLLKGASGQAVQNMNLMFGLPEPTGLL
ncbi:MAG: N-acetyl-gamma-glutamyl-phosphate reductase [Deltaproteobacteria bacterium]|nr:N-acetyl-gamma-glutamyl-phosphate reductase [Deltaproteobacteria bacterium]